MENVQSEDGTNIYQQHRVKEEKYRKVENTRITG
jgi:hypothetical protein